MRRTLVPGGSSGARVRPAGRHEGTEAGEEGTSVTKGDGPTELTRGPPSPAPAPKNSKRRRCRRGGRRLHLGAWAAGSVCG